ncbi:MAG TPA: outer membrane lipoprotein carrier protein LolA [Flavobacteriales bacterium]|nr:outer membrane lipoprotein carrier protein LolA [Flavobacteriales bacterium]HRN36921.1 outer membrane lipoprotein carrier protein LolA [Flavobacteriales bacterium]HRO39207.1 outer membrane lipoprotein carrier protein LolA [Flavobacteriales bacterium]HRP81710.1 outer membrane lipoprotein carrier protein LolA [Flavobacteriales bacterium]HRQ85647.1 outer membrane lipoprotein carrier protein LolA [Flavobacteriales bacterium]
MKNTILFFATLLLAANTYAQDDPKSRAIVDAVIAKNKTYKSFDADFSSRLVNTASKLDVKQDGNLKVKNRKFRLTLLDNVVINDGTALWTYSKKTNEVSITDPSEMDETLDPANLFNVYEKGFKSQYVGTGTEDGVAVETINLFPLEPAKKAYHTVVLTVDKAKMEPKKVVMKYKDGNVVTYTLKKFTPNAEMVDALFAFDKGKYPGVEVNDMR